MFLTVLKESIWYRLMLALMKVMFHVNIWFLTLKINWTIQSNEAFFTFTWFFIAGAIASVATRWRSVAFEIWTSTILYFSITKASLHCFKNKDRWGTEWPSPSSTDGYFKHYVLRITHEFLRRCPGVALEVLWSC